MSRQDMAAANDGGATSMVPATSAHFAWALRGSESALFADGLRLPAGGLESPEVLRWLDRTVITNEEATGESGAWLMVADDEVVGTISFKGLASCGVVEIGYGVARSRRRRGHATRAVALMIVEAAARGLDLIAETEQGNLPSQLVLERNGFQRCGERARRGQCRPSRVAARDA